MVILAVIKIIPITAKYSWVMRKIFWIRVTYPQFCISSIEPDFRIHILCKRKRRYNGHTNSKNFCFHRLLRL